MVELKRKTMIIQVFQEAVQHFFLFIFSVSNAKALTKTTSFLGFVTVRTVEDKVLINTPLFQAYSRSVA